MVACLQIFLFMLSSNSLFVKTTVALHTSFYGPHRTMGSLFIFRQAQDKILPKLGKAVRFTGPC